MGYFDSCSPEELYLLIEKHCNFFAKQLSEQAEIAVTIYINKAIVHEILARSRSTVTLFDKSGDDINHYKEAGILCYWIRKLKPVRIESPKLLAEILSLAKIKIEQEALGKLTIAEEDVKEVISHPINEQIGLDLAIDFIVEAHNSIIKDTEKEAGGAASVAIDTYKQELSANQSQFLKATDNLMWSLRYYNFSPIGISNMFETAFNTSYG